MIEDKSNDLNFIYESIFIVIKENNDYFTQ